MKNKKGSALFAIIISITIFMAGMIILNLIKPEIDTARSTTNLDCMNKTISDGAKVTCLATDATGIYFVLLIFSAIGGVLSEKFLV